MFFNKLVLGRYFRSYLYIFDYMYRKLYKTESSTKEIKKKVEGMKVSHLALESKTDSNSIL